jgi:antitoxin component YwqK of YwqJK toxin-antitoxin module
MRQLMIILFLLVFSTFHAIADSPFPICKDIPDGTVKDYYYSGRLKTEWGCKYGHLNGISKMYYENGQLHKESNYENDERQDITTSWYETGELKSVCNFDAGKLNGKHKILNKDGSVKELTYYKNGIEIVDKQSH